MTLLHVEIQILAKAVMRNAEWVDFHSENLCFRKREKADTHQNTRCVKWEPAMFKKQRHSNGGKEN